MMWFVISKSKTDTKFILKGRLTLIEELSDGGRYVWLYEGNKVEHKGIKFVSIDEVVRRGIEPFIKEFEGGGK